MEFELEGYLYEVEPIHQDTIHELVYSREPIEWVIFNTKEFKMYNVRYNGRKKLT